MATAAHTKIKPKQSVDWDHSQIGALWLAVWDRVVVPIVVVVVVEAVVVPRAEGRLTVAWKTI